MATKFYIQNVGATTGYPSGYIAGDDSGGGYYFLNMGQSPSGASNSIAWSKVAGSGSYEFRTLIKACTAPVSVAGTLDGSVSVVFGGKSSVAGQDYFVAGVGKINSAGVVQSAGTCYPGAGYLTTTGTGQGVANSPLSTSLSVAVGERLYLDLAVLFDVNASSGRQVTAWFGSTGSDLVDGSTAVTTNPPTIVFNSANVDAMFAGGGGGAGGAAQRGMLSIF